VQFDLGVKVIDQCRQDGLQDFGGGADAAGVLVLPAHVLLELLIAAEYGIGVHVRCLPGNEKVPVSGWRARFRGSRTPSPAMKILCREFGCEKKLAGPSGISRHPGLALRLSIGSRSFSFCAKWVQPEVCAYQNRPSQRKTAFPIE